MARTKAPALSMGAGGQIGKTMVYSKWRGVPYVRQHVIPANPKTAKQTSVRGSFALLREIFKLAPAVLLAPWNAFATGRPFTGMNKFVGENQRVLNQQADLTRFIASPGARGGLPPAAIAVTSPVATQIHVVATLPVLPDGWAPLGVFAIALKQQAPDGFFTGGVNVGSQIIAPFDVCDIDGLNTGDTYVVAVFLSQSKPDGSIAYSASISDTIVVA